MKPVLFRSLVLSVFMLLFFNLILYAQNSINVTSPKEGDSWVVGTSSDITWGSSGVANVKIEYSVDNGKNWKLIKSSLPEADGKFTWTVTGPASAECLIKISDASDASVFGVSDSKFTIAAPPAPVLGTPTDGTKSLSPTNLTLTWTEVTGANKYRVQIADENTFKTPVIDKIVTELKYQATTLDYNKTYYWRVLDSVSSVGSDFSNALSFKTKLKTPILSSPDDKKTGQAKNVSLEWQAVDGATTYSLQVSDNPSFDLPLIEELSGLDKTSQAMSKLENYKTYYWRVAGNDNGNTSDFSAVRSFTTKLASPVLKSPANNTANYTVAKVTYEWEKVEGATSYDIQICKGAASVDSLFKTQQKITDLQFASTDFLKYGQKYYWRVVAKNGTESSDYSDFNNFTVGTPKDLVSDVNAIIVFDHNNGSISQITFKKGSDKKLLNSSLNDLNRTGLGRVKGEVSTKLASWTEGNGKYTYNYENTTFYGSTGSKTLTIEWDQDGITVNMGLTLDANKSAVLSAAWQPGGDIGPINDHIVYTASDDSLKKTNLTYPVTLNTIYNGPSILTAAYDDSWDEKEYFGYKSDVPVQTLIQDGTALLGPVFTYPQSSVKHTINLDFAIQNKDNFFAWASKKFIIVSSPEKSEKLLDKSKKVINWESFGIPSASTLDIDLYKEGGKTLVKNLAIGVENNGSYEVTLPDDLPIVPLNDCIIKISAVDADDISESFSIVPAASTVFSIGKDLTAAPTTQISVPVKIMPASNSKISAFDVRVEYDKNLLTYVPGTLTKDKWSLDATNNATNGFVQVGGFMGQGGAPITDKDDQLFTLTFSIKSTARVGVQTPLKINNSYLSIADEKANPLNVAGEDGLITLYNRVSGYLRYIMNKKQIVGADIIKYLDEKNGDDKASTNHEKKPGFYDFSDKKPGSPVTVVPDSSFALPTPLSDAVDAIDAAKAFAGREGGSVTLSDLQKIAADVNKDGRINSTDALAILKLYSGELKHEELNKASNWVFVDSTFKLNSTNWALAPHKKTYSPLDSVNANQSYWGMVLGDVDGDYVPPTSQNMPAFAPSPKSIDISAAIFSVPSDLKGRPGDTLYLPLTVNLNGNNIGAFNTSLQLDKNLFTYCGKYNEGASFPADKGWTISAHFDSTGKLNIGATDFSGSLDPIIKDGPVAVFKFIVNSSAKLGDTCQVTLSGLSVADSKLAPVAVNTKNGKVTISNATSVEKNVVINDYSVAQNYPNPFNPSTTVKYALPAESKVDIEIFNSIGQKIADLFHGTQAFGYHKVEWNAKSMASGIYFYSIKATSLSSGKDFKSIKKMILMK